MNIIIILISLGCMTGLLAAVDCPQAEISNGFIRAKLYLPDAQNGYYRATRFDWSGVISSLEFGGHNYYGPWFDRTDPKVRDFIYQGAEIVAGPCSAMTGPAEEFQTKGTALGWDEAKPGGTFIKIGVGVLRKDAENYSFAKLYEIVDPGRWTIQTGPTAIEFTHDLSDPSSGYAYQYHKTVRLTKDKPELVLEHRLKNTGQRVIQSSVYNHNFLVLDRQSPGPDFSIIVPYQIQSRRPPNPALAEIQGNQIVYLKPLVNQDLVQTGVQGFSDQSKDNNIRIENKKIGAGLRMTCDRPLSNNTLWSIRSVLAMEPFIAMTINPGSEFTWNVSIEYYTLTAK